MKTEPTALRRGLLLKMIAAASLCLAAAAASAEVLSPALERKLSAPAGGSLPVIVIFKGTPAGSSAFKGAPSPAAALRAQAARPSLAAVLPAGASAAEAQDLWLVNGYALRLAPAAVESLARDPRVEAVVENFQVQSPEILPQGGDTPNAEEGNWGLAKIGVPAIKELFGATGRGVRIGHLDTGVDPSHPDLRGKIAAWAEFDAAGRPVPASRPHDSGVHGTHTAGILVGGDAGGASIGVAPGARLLSALVLNGNTGTLAQVIAGMQWVLDPDGNPSTDDGAQILSMSLGAPGQYDIFRTLVDRLLAAGVLPVIAIGNNGAGRADAPGNSPGALAVGALTPSDVAAYFSGGGEVAWGTEKLTKPEISAPGYAILSSIPGGMYRAYSGTSMAAPHVAGAAALLLELRPGLSVEELRRALMESALDLGAPGMDVRTGRGRLDVLAAASALTDLSILRGVVRGGSAPMAVVRVKDAAGRTLKVARADDEGRFQLALAEGDYLVTAAYGAARGEERSVRVRRGEAASLELSLAAGAEELDSLLVYPNPYRPGRGDQSVTFEGLPADARVEVYSLSGALVRELSDATKTWDGKNASGETAASGVYLYVARRYDPQNGWEAKSGKLAVIR